MAATRPPVLRACTAGDGRLAPRAARVARRRRPGPLQPPPTDAAAPTSIAPATAAATIAAATATTAAAIASHDAMRSFPNPPRRPTRSKFPPGLRPWRHQWLLVVAPAASAAARVGDSHHGAAASGPRPPI